MAQEQLLTKIDGSHNTERWNVSVSSINKADDGTYIIIGKRNRLL